MRLGLRPAAKELGISHVALLKAEKAGRLKREKDGKYDVEACRIALVENSSPKKQASARAQQRKPEPAEPAEPENPNKTTREPERSDNPDSQSYSEAVRRREWVRLRKEEMELLRRKGEVVEIAPVNAYVAGMIIKSRDELMKLGAELRDRLATESDPLKCEALVTRRIEQILSNLAEYKR